MDRIDRAPFVTMPRPPEPEPPRPFPLFATLAPVLASVILWVLTQSVLALAFAALGPVVAVAGLVDGRRASRRALRRARARFDEEVAHTWEVIRDLHRSERKALDARGRSSLQLLSAGVPAPESPLSSGCAIRVGRGEVASAVESRGGSGQTADRRARDDASTILAELAGACGRLSDAPVDIPIGGGVQVFALPVLAESIARSLVIQLANLSPPDTVAIEGPDDACWDWLDLLPHRLVRGPCSRSVSFTESASGPDSTERIEVRIEHTSWAAKARPSLEPADRGPENAWAANLTTIDADAPVNAVIRTSDGVDVGRVIPEAIGVAQATVWAAAWGASWRKIVTDTASRQPTEASPAGAGALACSFATSAAGPLQVDLVADGPHAVIGGTTGSGKSELLVSWATAMAERHPPEDVALLFVDFKGGAAFDQLRALPHTVGIITDLDDAEADRALRSLRAELRRRERFLVAAGARSIDEARAAGDPSREALHRLVIVVDEFAAMVEAHPDLQAVFGDIASRGRSLGMHLILCTQRPVGVIRDSILANCDLRISLRVNNRSDSIAVIGVDSAASIPASERGVAYVAAGGVPPRRVQVALLHPTDVAAAASRWDPALHPTPWRPWRESLPARLTVEQLQPLSVGETGSETDALAFGVADLPDEQRQEAAQWSPNRDGHLLVLGAAKSGKSGVVAALGEAGSSHRDLETEVVPGRADLLWDVTSELLTRAPADGRRRLILLDDVDRALAACPDEFAGALADRLTTVLREGEAQGVAFILTAQRIPPLLQSAVANCPARLVLRMPTRQDRAMIGAEGREHVDDAPPGRGHWRGAEVQVVFTASGTRAERVAACTEVDLAAGAIAVVASSPRLFRARLEAHVPGLTYAAPDQWPAALAGGEAGTVILGDPETWQSHWGALARVRENCPVVFDGCSVGEFRTLTRLREVPPPPSPGDRAIWLLTDDGSVGRARFVGRSSLN